jgi:hypothetical protein
VLSELDNHPQRLRRLINLLRRKAQHVTRPSEHNFRGPARRNELIESRIAALSVLA